MAQQRGGAGKGGGVVMRALRRGLRRAWTKAMDRLGGRLVSGMADTSSDAPAAAYQPKRDLYAQLQREAEAAKGHAHDHGHDHDHKG